jgi:hypothetical protein
VPAAHDAFRAYSANLLAAHLSDADLSRGNLREADLVRADLSEADLSEADLRGAILPEAIADLNGDDLLGPNLSGAMLRGATKGRGETCSARETGNVVMPDYMQEPLERLSTADIRDVQQIAAAQIELLDVYRREALRQSKLSFSVALGGSAFGLLLFAVAVGFSLVNGLNLASVVPLIAGAIVQVVSGVVFYLYGQTSSQLSALYSRLESLQRYLLANSLCEHLEGTARNDARADLIKVISAAQPLMAHTSAQELASTEATRATRLKRHPRAKTSAPGPA